MANVTTSSNSSAPGPMMYMSTSEDGKTPAAIITIGAVFSGLATVAVLLRFYARLQVTRSGLGADDWLMFVSYLLTLGMGTMLVTGSVLNALAQPTPEGWAPGDYFWVTDNAEVITEKIFWVFIMVQDLAFGLAKLSVLYLYRRIFFVSWTFNVLSMVMIIIVGIWTVGFFFAYLFRCGTNFWALWAPLEDLLENCYNSQPMFYTLAISDVITDVLILSLPLFWIWKMNLSPGKKIAVSGVFLLGFLEVATGLARLIIFIQQTTDYILNADGIGLLTTLMVWSMVEMGIAVVAGCLPTIWPIMTKIPVKEVLQSARKAFSLYSRRSTRKQTPHHDDSKWYQTEEIGDPYVHF